jgi:hypothetical protein
MDVNETREAQHLKETTTPNPTEIWGQTGRTPFFCLTCSTKIGERPVCPRISPSVPAFLPSVPAFFTSSLERGEKQNGVASPLEAA